ncbi:DUF4373 domain-containing protein [Paenibacillus graminis]|uniref:DUF4373 domain-containing protein n=1 Tax=Paenibacillus graminis TaxID=189425 RepID=UPI002DB7A85F|nr:DUF4373 domain-containing protein [Paenibacillus graminis]MEC0171145.1 DUF4373 domain-containing protein [Paenibacillus graminis]
MARPTKEGLDYFPLDIDFDQDDKLVVPVNKYGMQGLGIIVKLMAEIYRNGYFYPWGEREQYVFSNRVNVDINSINDVVNECVKWDFFHAGLFGKYQILTSKGFQKRFIEASKRRKITTFIHEYTLIDLQAACKKCSPINEVDVNGNEVNVYINSDKVSNMSTESTQRESKEKVKRNKRESKKDIKDLSAEIENFRSRYSPELSKILDQYLDFIRETRSSKKIADSIVLKILTYFSKYSLVQVEYAMLQHMSMEEKRSAPEEYTFGIVRKSTEIEAARKLQQLKEGRKGKQTWDSDAYLDSLKEE